MSTRKPRGPRSACYYGMRTTPTLFLNGTWLEPEALTYPSGGFRRRALAQFDDGSTRVVRCSVPDTYFSVPARAKIAGATVKGWITADEHGVIFHAAIPS